MDLPGVLLLALTLLGVAVAGVVALIAARRGRTRAAKTTVLVAAAWMAAYASLLVVTSLTSREHTLALGETKRFCGFYLDCHMGVAVERVDTTSRVGEGSDAIEAGGTFYVITLRVSSDARRVPLHLHQPRAIIIDAEGYRHDRALDAEQRLARGQTANLNQRVTAGESFTRQIVFDVPRAVREPRLHVSMGTPIERAVELAIIGDEDALLHAPTLHALNVTSGVSSAGDRDR